MTKQVWLPPTAFETTDDRCLARVLAHEALHTALRTTPKGQLHAERAPEDTLTATLQVVGLWLSYDLQGSEIDLSANDDAGNAAQSAGPNDNTVESYINKSVNACVTCQ